MASLYKIRLKGRLERESPDSTTVSTVIETHAVHSGFPLFHANYATTVTHHAPADKVAGNVAGL